MTYFVPYMRTNDKETIPMGTVVNNAVDRVKLYMRTASPEEVAKALEHEITGQVLYNKRKNRIVLFTISDVPFRLKHVKVIAKDGEFIMTPIADFFTESGPDAVSPKQLVNYITPVLRFDKNNLLSISSTGEFVHSRTKPEDLSPEIVKTAKQLSDLGLEFVNNSVGLSKGMEDIKSIFCDGTSIAKYNVSTIISQRPPHQII